MNDIVVWPPQASNGLLATLLRAADKPAGWAAAAEIEARLRVEPNEAGESREGAYRLVFVRPYSVLYLVDDQVQTVYVEQLQWVGG